MQRQQQAEAADTISATAAAAAAAAKSYNCVIKVLVGGQTRHGSLVVLEVCVDCDTTFGFVQG